LKNQGNNLEHSFGHGKKHPRGLYFLLNLLAYQFHPLLELGDEEYRKARATAGRRDTFFTIYRQHYAIRCMKHGGIFAFCPW
jgi:hypothetical protein